jgi:hypothetical protein
METLRREVGAFGWVMRTLVMGAVAAAIYKEMQLPKEKRTWHGQLLSFVPYDFRVPTPKRFVKAFWDPKADRLFNDQPFGVGWVINLPVAFRMLKRVIGSAR